MIAGAPLLAAMPVIAGGRGQLAFEARCRSRLPGRAQALRHRAHARAARHATGRRHPTTARPRSSPRRGTPALRQAMEILERVASVEERAVYRRFVLTLAESAGRAARKRRPTGTRPPDRATPSATRCAPSPRSSTDRRSPCRQGQQESNPTKVPPPRPRTISPPPSPRGSARSPALRSWPADTSPDTRPCCACSNGSAGTTPAEA